MFIVRHLIWLHCGIIDIFLKNTGQEFDGSDSGARPDEAISWGKIRADAESVKVRYARRLDLRLLLNGIIARPGLR